MYKAGKITNDYSISRHERFSSASFISDMLRDVLLFRATGGEDIVGLDYSSSSHADFQ